MHKTEMMLTKHLLHCLTHGKQSIYISYNCYYSKNCSLYFYFAKRCWTLYSCLIHSTSIKSLQSIQSFFFLSYCPYLNLHLCFINLENITSLLGLYFLFMFCPNSLLIFFLLIPPE